MKFWKKIFSYSVMLFLILFNGAGIILIEKIHSDSLETVIKSTIDRYSNIEAIIYSNTDYLVDSDIDIENSVSNKNWLEIIINGYSIDYNMVKPNIEIYSKDNKLIMSNSNIKIDEVRKEIIHAKKNERSFLIRTVNNKKYLFVSSIINLKNTDFKFILSTNIEYLYIQKINNYKFFLALDIVISIILAIGMYIISKKLTDPIVRLSKTSKDIANGDYTKRVMGNKNNDEIGVLENNFNIMIDVIENNIEELKYMNESKQRFIDSLNHEIKTPITSIIGYSELLLKGKVSESTKIKSLTYINSEAKRLEVLNSTLLKLILIREEKINEEKISIKECIINTYSSLRYKFETNNINLKIDIEDEYIYADKQLIIVLLTNIMDNSIKASNKDDNISVSGKYIKDDKSYILKIKDNGIGIPEEDIDKILEPFYMVDKARSRKNNGVGLGLSICYEICKVHNIIFNINSKVDLGTEVILKFSKENKS
ncbi:HAMP domain-containing sensor histidine kinase [Clostridium sp. CCUG 7971]|uniref:sensor histidine kinase n=1 Tax=Clostridium sp. CCUG 7971 TaxID=2811414 RepID=UPI001ABB8EC1|nr:HAMP domain-containing sensor histidine kinase [Clostridium sp. CCUG 7971]MBO3444861.1 HAMP domain-containing histidine kinase [Clostridium sp. CCUG 7971]